MPTVTIKGRILHQNLVPVGGADVEVFDDDTVVSRRGLRVTTSTRTDSLGTIRTNENGWFEARFDFAIGDAARISLEVRKGGRAFRFDALPPGEPSLVTDWPGPQLFLAHEDPNPVARLANLTRRLQTLPVDTVTSLRGSAVAFPTPLSILRPLFSSGTPFDAFAVPMVQPPPPFFAERNQVNDLFDGAAADARADASLVDGDRDSYRRMLDHVPAGLAFAPTGKPSSLERGGGQVPSDAYFAEQRLAGANPMRIARVGSAFTPVVPFAVADDDARRLTGYTAPQLADARRLYACDYRQLAPAYEAFGTPSCAKLATVGLFYLDDPPPVAPVGLARDVRDRGVLRDRGSIAVRGGVVPAVTRAPDPAGPGMTLLPLAILLVEPGQPDRVVLPGDADWDLAKLALQANDTLVHEVKYHLWDCHFAMEPIVLAMIRQLDDRHPLRELLVRHTYGLLWINNYGFEFLVNPGGPAATYLGVDLDGVATLLGVAQTEWSWATMRVKRHVADRGLDALPSFPYRDDAVRLFDAIRTFTGEYVAAYYDGDAEVRRDAELAAWLSEMSSFGVAGLPAVTTRDGLADLVAEFVFQMSVQHAAVNTPQWDYLANTLNAPGYVKPLDGAAPPDPLAARLPDVDHAIGMMQLMGKLANFFVEPGGLGHYRDLWSPTREKLLPFSDRAAEDAAKRFRAAIDRIETAIQQEDLTRQPAYRYLLPKRIDNSTHK